MASSTEPEIDEIVRRAQQGRAVRQGEYSLLPQGRSLASALPPNWLNHNELEKGDQVVAYADYEHRCVVLFPEGFDE